MRPAVLVASRALLTTFVVGCGARTARPPSSDDHRPPPSTEPPPTTRPATPSDAADAAEPAEPPPTEPPPTAAPQQPRLAWVNPARCAKPCTYDPQDDLVRVNEQGGLDAAGPHRVHRSIQEPVRDLVAAARAAGHKIRIESAFRSYDDQARVFKQTKQVGRAARPGHSEHQLGTAVDFRMPTSAAIRWLAEQAPARGFALSYPDGKQRTTGYRPEPWHVRFVGNEIANELSAKGSTLEELFRARPELGESGSCDDCPGTSPPLKCGDISAAGKCDGNVLKWCYDDTLATVDCAAFKQRCGRSADNFDCIAR
jgi:zinc D-Ala-D-Ala carboxypeptidase